MPILAVVNPNHVFNAFAARAGSSKSTAQQWFTTALVDTLYYGTVQYKREYAQIAWVGSMLSPHCKMNTLP